MFFIVSTLQRYEIFLNIQIKVVIADAKIGFSCNFQMLLSKKEIKLTDFVISDVCLEY